MQLSSNSLTWLTLEPSLPSPDPAACPASFQGKAEPSLLRSPGLGYSISKFLRKHFLHLLSLFFKFNSRGLYNPATSSPWWHGAKLRSDCFANNTDLKLKLRWELYLVLSSVSLGNARAHPGTESEGLCLNYACNFLVLMCSKVHHPAKDEGLEDLKREGAGKEFGEVTAWFTANKVLPSHAVQELWCFFLLTTVSLLLCSLLHSV